MKIIPKPVSILLTLIMVVSLFTAVPFTANAAPTTLNDTVPGIGTVSGAQTNASIYTYTVNNGVVTINRVFYGGCNIKTAEESGSFLEACAEAHRCHSLFKQKVLDIGNSNDIWDDGYVGHE